MLIFLTNEVMNSTENGHSEAAIPRWVREGAGDNANTLLPHERTVLEEVLRALRRVRHGSVTLAIQDGRVVQIESTEKKRL
jgi:hypothetical protein